MPIEKRSVVLDESEKLHPTLTLFLQVKTKWKEGRLCAKLFQGNGSGDFVSLPLSDGIDLEIGLAKKIIVF